MRPNDVHVTRVLAAQFLQSYLLPPTVRNLNKTCHPLYVLERPRSGWLSWIPERENARSITPPRAVGRHWSPFPQRESSRIGRRALAADITTVDSIVGRSSTGATQSSRYESVVQQRPPSPLREVARSHKDGASPDDVFQPSSDYTSISSATPTLFRYLDPATTTSEGQTVIERAPVRFFDT